MKDPYKILNVRKEAEQEVISAAYKALARKYHPDVSELDAERMKEINWAYEILKDRKQRANWDTQYRQKTSKRPAKPKPKPPNQQTAKTENPSNALRGSIRLIAIAVIGTALLLWIGSLTRSSETAQNQPSVTTTHIIRTSPPTTRTLSPLQAAVKTDAAELEANQTLAAGSPTQFYLLSNNCVRYTEVNQTYLGQSICVYGTVNRDWCSGAYEIIAFTDNYSNYESTDFRFVAPGGVPDSLCAAPSWHYLTAYEDAFEEVASQVTWFDGLSQPGNCVAATGEITRFEDFSYVTIDIGRPETYLIWLSPDSCQK